MTENQQQQKLRIKVLRRVYRLWLFRRSAPLIIIEIFVGWIALAIFAHYVFVEKVVSNALLMTLGNPLRLIMYGVGAFGTTNTIIKIYAIAELKYAFNSRFAIVRIF